MLTLDPLSAADELAATAAERAPLIEQERRLPPNLVAALADAGLFRLCVPAAAGGLEAPPATLVEAVATLARADGATGWCVAIGATSGLIAGYLPTEAAREIHSGERTITGGVFAPMGQAVPDGDGGYTVSGRWPFASGCQHCDWLMGGCVVPDGDGVRMLPGGGPDIRLMLVPASEVTIHDTWDTVGLRGTGSHDIEMAAVSAPASHGASVFTDDPVAEGPLYAFPLFGLLAVAIGAVCVGLAEGALDDVYALAAQRVPAGGRRSVAQRPTAQAQVARAEAATRAARSLLLHSVDQAWDQATTNGVVPVEERAALRLAAAHAAEVATTVTSECFRLGGGGAAYSKSPLGRRLRDAQTANQHMLVAGGVWELTGRLLMGQPTDTAQL